MMNELRFIPYNIEKKKTKKKPNTFIYFRNEMLKRNEISIRMTDFSRRIAEKWKELTEEEKDDWHKIWTWPY
ncbi:hypothetical protein GLOIN_2v1766062 [Rhizophagus clarus]|uniref:HMG box domain-containing protein n=1 Tax=Rhizophagus clarus TaxID=94130 RepID=A0A8H3QUC1_9GLOM|nr:hypothetical protein GLOIN_2v1766062 [Rhizophagus clarus]